MDGVVTLPMFPLSAVVFPGSLLPLHVFEARYRQLVEDLDDTGGRFGIVLITRGSEVGGGDVRSSIGVEVEVEYLSTGADGRSMLVVRALERLQNGGAFEVCQLIVHRTRRDGGTQAATRIRLITNLPVNVSWRGLFPRRRILSTIGKGTGDPPMSPLAILVIALALVIAGVLALRLHAFLTLIVAALVVAALTPGAAASGRCVARRAAPAPSRSQA